MSSSPVSSTLLNSNSNSNSTSNTTSSDPVSHNGSGSNLASLDSMKKKRVGKACDSCRLKKTKCNGKQPCERCTADNKICIYTERKKSKDKVYSSEYVELIDRRLSLVNKSLLKLCEMVKLNKKSDLMSFIKDLEYNESDEISPISVNQAISLLVDEHELEVDRKEFSASTATAESMNKAAIKSNLNAVSSLNFKKSSKKVVAPILPSEGHSIHSQNNLNLLSSPESLSPKSSEFSPNFNAVGENSLGSGNIPLSKIKEEEDIDDRDTPLLDQFDSVPLTSDYSTYETNSNMVSPIDELDDVAMMGFNSLDLGQFHSNSIGLLNNSTNNSNNSTNNSNNSHNINNSCINSNTNNNNNNNSNNYSHGSSISSALNSSNASATNLTSKTSMAVPPPMASSIQIPSATIQTNELVSPSENSLAGYFSPSSITSDSSVLMFDSMLDTTPVLLGTENSFMDSLSMSPPTSLVKRSSSSCSTIGSGSVKKLQHHHNRSHSHSHSHGHSHNHAHPLTHNYTNNIINKSNSNSSNSISNNATSSSGYISQVQSMTPHAPLKGLNKKTKTSGINPTSLDSSMVASLSSDLNMHYNNEEYVQF
ncbi:hypothetical protein PMKS-000343 [Pichia membranifaciens]|uniref:Zn(2)-C6 fungal-type domain-containing protein n=1 Tax=Pichia membranifaciens TaxID=4926 RepID=A0A1Q2YBG8_9ASCO|nr:hypothetical protein PMKS-000343 [Pichia membranifaciens]